MVNPSRRRFIKNLFGFGAAATLGATITGIVRSEKNLTKQEAERLEHLRRSARDERKASEKIALVNARNKKEFELLQKEYLDTVGVAPPITLKIMQSNNPRQLLGWLKTNGKTYRRMYESRRLKGKQIAINKRIFGKEIEKSCKEFGFPANVAKKLIQKESMWDPLAVSPAGESFGLLQMHTSLIGSKYTNEYFHNPFDPLQSIHFGVKYLSKLYNHFNGDLEKTLTAYNIRGGQETIDRAVKANGEKWRDYRFSITSNKYYTAVMQQRIE